MKKLSKCLCILTSIVLLLTLVTSGYAETAVESPNNNSCEEFLSSVYGKSQSETIDMIGENLSVDTFGGLYLDEAGNLVVNVTDLRETSLARNALMNGDIENVSFTKVKYSLSFLENAVDELVPHMKEYSILMLDANDETNLLDIYLADYSQSNLEQLEILINTLSIPNDCVNYVDKSGCYAECTVKKIDSNIPDDAASQVEPQDIISDRGLVPGRAITIGEYGYSLGPWKTSAFLSAGHKCQIWSAVRYGGITVGTCINASFGGNRDISAIHINSPAYGQTSAMSYYFDNPLVGDKISMLGATTGGSRGRVTNLNARVYYSDLNQTLTLACGNYSCAKGDSGGPIFNDVQVAQPSDFNLGLFTVCYGVQSGGAFDENGNWAGSSYFTLASNLTFN